jgi:hypothetical protein
LEYFQCNIASKYSLIEECETADNEYGGRLHHEEKLKIQNNLLKIDVYFENLRVKSVEQSPTYKASYHGFRSRICIKIKTDILIKHCTMKMYGGVEIRV